MEVKASSTAKHEAAHAIVASAMGLDGDWSLSIDSTAGNCHRRMVSDQVFDALQEMDDDWSNSWQSMDKAEKSEITVHARKIIVETIAGYLSEDMDDDNMDFHKYCFDGSDECGCSDSENCDHGIVVSVLRLVYPSASGWISKKGFDEFEKLWSLAQCVIANKTISKAIDDLAIELDELQDLNADDIYEYTSGVFGTMAELVAEKNWKHVGILSVLAGSKFEYVVV